MATETIVFQTQQFSPSGLLHPFEIEATIDTDTNQVTATTYRTNGQEFTPTEQSDVDKWSERISYVRQRKSDLGGSLPERDESARELPEAEL